MDAEAFPTPDEPVDELAPRALEQMVSDGEDVTILDARSTGDFEEWHIDGEGVEIANVPYFEFIEGLDEELLTDVPQGDPLVVLCAKGGASEYVAGLLQEEGRDVVHLEDGMNGYASVYHAVEVEAYDGPGTVLQYQRPSSGCLGYMVYDDEEAAVIDPLQAFTDRYLEDAADLGVDLTYAFDTHIHADHVSGVRALDEAGVTGVIPSAAVDRGVTYADDLLTTEDGDTFSVGDATVEVVYTPGHTSGMTSYLVGDSLLTTGDGLFTESVARPDLEEGDEGAPDAARQLYESLQERVLALDDDVLVGGAHFSDSAEPAADGTYTAPIGDLTESMAALTAEESEFVEQVLADMPPRPANYEDIIATNLGQRDTDEEEAFALELGPNNCAASQESMTSD
ncbi:MBL fold metallo-hydrolase [Halomicroarcula sp. GCM10025324]|uniref:MBL fold metallo-hydrolase n=1 Tax=Haloarcula TaxID=2237 RepID=UPI0023E7D774|nr:MBL fold metallo-hydrolase [Halomicroarcula sp. ZS-22-S1]